MSNELKVKINSKLASLSAKKKRVAYYLLEHTEQAKKETISEIAEKCQVSVGTISLFAQDLGLSGFKELSVLLSNSNQNFSTVINDHSRMEDIVQQTIQDNINNIQSTYQNLDLKKLNQAAQLIFKSHELVFFGLGGSAGVAYQAFNNFLKTPISVKFNPDFHLQLVMAGKMTSQDCAIIISHSGINQDIQRIVNIIKETQAKIVTITSFDDTPLTQASDYYFLSLTDEFEYNDVPVYSRRITQILLIDLLFTLVMYQDSKVTLPNLKVLRNALKYTNTTEL